MRRTVGNGNVARLRPVEKIELSGKHIGWRLLAVLLFLGIAVASITYGIMLLLSPGEPGWTEIKAKSGAVNCAGDFTFLYEIGVSGRSVSAEQRALNALYTQLTEKAWQIFSNVEGTEGIRYLNDHPNEDVEVDAALYRALAQAEASGSRMLYLAPVAEIYNGLFSCQDDVLTVDFDPLLNDDLRTYFAEVAAFARDPEAIRVELKGNNTVCIRVSAVYQAFIEQEEIANLVDFHWMRNAFIIDYLADELIAQGYTFGTLSSNDGFARALDDRGSVSYGYNLYDRGNLAGVMRYRGRRSMVALRGYPLSSLDSERFYVRRDGQIRTAYLDVTDGLSRVAADDLIAYADDRGCAELVLRVAPVYIADSLDEDALAALAQDGFQSIWFDDGAIRSTDTDVTVSDPADEPH